MKQKLNRIQKDALDYFHLYYAKSEERGAGWFAYMSQDTQAGYPGSSCECIEDVVRWYGIAASSQRFAESVE